MTCLRKIEYKIIPKEAFKIRRGCAGCGCKQIFVSSGNFRVNANGSRLDVWLIYRCEKCGHTYNLSIYERVRPERIPQAEYRAFLSNDEDAAFRYGTNKAVFSYNRAEVAWDVVESELVPVRVDEFDVEKDIIEVVLHNTCDLPVREDKVLAGILQMSRSQVKRLAKEERLLYEVTSK